MIAKTQNLKIRNRSGFTMVETLVAISILMLAIATAFTIVPNGLAAGRYAKNQITATYLAQEGMEMIRNNRDNGMFFESAGNPERWLSHVDVGGVSLDDCLQRIGRCGVNTYLPPGYSATLYACDSGCEPLRYLDTDSGERVYGHGSPFDGKPESIFTREVTFKKVFTYAPSGERAGPYEIAINVVVSWKEAGGVSKSVSLRENLFNWYDR